MQSAETRDGFDVANAGTPVIPVPSSSQEAKSREWLTSVAVLAGTVCGGAVLVALGGLFSFGSFSDAVAYFQGYRVVPVERVVSLSRAVVGQRATFAFRLRNLSGQPVRVVGADASCGCVAVDDLPLTIDPGTDVEMRAWFVPAERDLGNTIEHTIGLFLDIDGPPVGVICRAAVMARATEVSAETAAES